RPVDAGQPEHGRLDVCAPGAAPVQRSIDRVADAVGGAAQPDRLPVAGAGGASPEQRPLVVEDRSVRLRAASVHPQADRQRRPADLYERSTTSITTAPSSPLGRGCRPASTASMNSAICAEYIGWEQCSYPSGISVVGHTRAYPDVPYTSVSASSPSR